MNKEIRLADVIKRYLEDKDKKLPVWLFSTTVEENVTEDAEFEIVEPKQLPQTVENQPQP